MIHLFYSYNQHLTKPIKSEGKIYNAEGMHANLQD